MMFTGDRKKNKDGGTLVTVCYFILMAQSPLFCAPCLSVKLWGQPSATSF
jgi:hypothetical protein